MTAPTGKQQAGPAVGHKRARVATGIAFLLTGLVFATWATRIPARKAELGLTDAELAIAFVGLNAGAVVGLQIGAVVVTRFGSRNALFVALPLFAGMLLPLALAPNLPALSCALAFSAAANSVVDVAINDHGVGIQHAYGRSLLTGLHALHSVGGVLGGMVAAAAAHIGLSVTAHFTMIAGAVPVLALIFLPSLLPPQQLHTDRAATKQQTGLLSGWTGRLLVLGAAAFVFTLAEGSALDWSAVLLTDHRGAAPSLAAAGLAIFQTAITVGRLLGDRAIDRAGPVAVFTGSALLGGLGLTIGLLLGSVTAALAGLALFGLGLATLLPISISAAGTANGADVPVAVARVSTLGYLGSFTGPAVIGFLTHHSSLPTALLLPAIAVTLAAIAAPATRPGQSPGNTPDDVGSSDRQRP